MLLYKNSIPSHLLHNSSGYGCPTQNPLFGHKLINLSLTNLYNRKSNHCIEDIRWIFIFKLSWPRKCLPVIRHLITKWYSLGLHSRKRYVRCATIINWQSTCTLVDVNCASDDFTYLDPGGGGGGGYSVCQGIFIGSAGDTPLFQPPWYDKRPPPPLSVFSMVWSTN